MCLQFKRQVTPEQGIEILKLNGKIATKKEAGEILGFLYKTAEISVKQFINSK
jgi:hypothetical protein